MYDEELGDTRLALGMRAYECCRTRINRLADAGDFTWLSKLTPDGRFTFQIGNTPVRFSRNDAESLPDRKLLVSEGAEFQMSLFEAQPYNDVRWFFVFDTQYDAAADAVFFVGYSEHKEIVCQWQIPVENNVALISVVDGNQPAPVELGRPKVSVKKIIDDKKVDGEGPEDDSPEEK